MRNEDIVTIKFFIFIVVMLISVIGAVWVSKKYFEKSIYETFKTIGVKALGLIALLNVFSYGSDKLLEYDSTDPEQED